MKIDRKKWTYEIQILKNWDEIISQFCRNQNYTHHQTAVCKQSIFQFEKWRIRLNKKIEKETDGEIKNAVLISHVQFQSVDQLIYNLITQNYVALFSESFLKIPLTSNFSNPPEEDLSIFCEIENDEE